MSKKETKIEIGIVIFYIALYTYRLFKSCKALKNYMVVVKES